MADNNNVSYDFEYTILGRSLIKVNNEQNIQKLPINKDCRTVMLFGECVFHFTKILLQKEEYKGWNLIATEYRPKELLREYGDFIKNLEDINNLRNQGTNVFIVYGLDVTKIGLIWNNIFDGLKLDGMHFNFPYIYYEGRSEYQNDDLIISYFKVGQSFLKDGGCLKTTLDHGTYYEKYNLNGNLEDFVKRKGFTLKLQDKPANIFIKYKDYKHYSSLPKINILGNTSGYEYTFTKVQQSDINNNLTNYSGNQ